MATRRAATPAKQLFNGFRLSQRVQQQQQPCLARSMATITTTTETPSSALDMPIQPTPTPKRYKNKSKTQNTAAEAPRNPFLTTTQCTLHDFPSFEPTSFVTYPSSHLQMPLRKDILHRAVIYEGDMTRQGTASTKYRSEVHGSNRKISNLINMMRHARHDVLVSSDSDLHVAPDYLERLVAALEPPGVGLVTTVCHGLPTVPGLAARLGATGISHCFTPGALLSRALGAVRRG